MVKRIFDVILSVCGLMFFLPALLVVAFILFVTDGFHVFYRQKRVGLSGAPFLIYKFRTMTVDADSVGPLYTAKNDARITPFGSFLRKTSLDELPQLFNVLVGNMSLVGPRPNVFDQEKDYRHEDWEQRHSVKPGITGLAQVSGRSNCTFEERLSFDLKYVCDSSLSLDMKIIVRTVISILFKKGTN